MCRLELQPAGSSTLPSNDSRSIISALGFHRDGSHWSFSLRRCSTRKNRERKFSQEETRLVERSKRSQGSRPRWWGGRKGVSKSRVTSRQILMPCTERQGGREISCWAKPQSADQVQWGLGGVGGGRNLKGKHRVSFARRFHTLPGQSSQRPHSSAATHSTERCVSHVVHLADTSSKSRDPGLCSAAGSSLTNKEPLDCLACHLCSIAKYQDGLNNLAMHHLRRAAEDVRFDKIPWVDALLSLLQYNARLRGVCFAQNSSPPISVPDSV